MHIVNRLVFIGAVAPLKINVVYRYISPVEYMVLPTGKPADSTLLIIAQDHQLALVIKPDLVHRLNAFKVACPLVLMCVAAPTQSLASLVFNKLSVTPGASLGRGDIPQNHGTLSRLFHFWLYPCNQCVPRAQ